MIATVDDGLSGFSRSQPSPCADLTSPMAAASRSGSGLASSASSRVLSAAPRRRANHRTPCTQPLGPPGQGVAPSSTTAQSGPVTTESSFGRPGAASVAWLSCTPSPAHQASSSSSQPVW